jgi:hypothetical protein
VASSSACRDAGAEETTTPATVATATSKKATNFIMISSFQHAYSTHASLGG